MYEVTLNVERLHKRNKKYEQLVSVSQECYAKTELNSLRFQLANRNKELAIYKEKLNDQEGRETINKKRFNQTSKNLFLAGGSVSGPSKSSLLRETMNRRVSSEHSNKTIKLNQKELDEFQVDSTIEDIVNKEFDEARQLGVVV